MLVAQGEKNTLHVDQSQIEENVESDGEFSKVDLVAIDG
jgi:hypothetical protein